MFICVSKFTIQSTWDERPFGKRVYRQNSRIFQWPSYKLHKSVVGNTAADAGELRRGGKREKKKRKSMAQRPYEKPAVNWETCSHGFCHGFWYMLEVINTP